MSLCMYPETFYDPDEYTPLLVFCEREEGHQGPHRADLENAIPDPEDVFS